MPVCKYFHTFVLQSSRYMKIILENDGKWHDFLSLTNCTANYLHFFSLSDKTKRLKFICFQTLVLEVIWQVFVYIFKVSRLFTFLKSPDDMEWHIFECTKYKLTWCLKRIEVCQDFDLRHKEGRKIQIPRSASPAHCA